MIAFVLSGGGNRGAMQVGALQVLLEAGIQPEMFVGTSAGAVSAAFLATNPTPTGAYRLGEIWQNMAKVDVYPGGPLSVIWHLFTHRDSFYPSNNFRAFLETHAPPGTSTFRQLAVDLYIVATDLITGGPYIFGADTDENLLDALMASVSLPPLFAPWRYKDRLLVDGGVAASLPVRTAGEKGATEVYALEIQREMLTKKSRWNIKEIGTRSIYAMIRQQWERDFALCAVDPEVTIHHLVLQTRQPLAFDDFSHGAELIAEGREVAEAYLAAQDRFLASSKHGRIIKWKKHFRQVGDGIKRLWRTSIAHFYQREDVVPG